MNDEIKEKKSGSKWVIGLAGLAIIVSFGVGLQAGKTQGIRSVVPDGERTVDVSGKSQAEAIDFDLFWDVWNTLKEDHVNQPVSEEDLFNGALHGLVEGLGDKYSAYFTPEESDDFNAEIDGTFSGIGAEIDEEENYIVVVSPLKDSPAQNAGLRSGDLIVAVDEVSTFEMSVFEAVSIIRGEKESEVTLAVVRNGEQSLDITIVRDNITINSVDWEVRDDNILVISMFMFNQDTTRLFTEAVQEGLAAGIDGVVIDVRNNPGGLLSQAVNVAGFWTGNQTVVIEDMRTGDNELKSNSNAPLAGVPTVVLVNGGSASASEILAGALQDYDLAHIIGEQSFGKGTVQELRSLVGGGALKITVAQWLTPNRKSIQDEGITPDEVVEFTEEDLNAEQTPQIEAAIRYLKTR